MKIKQYLNKHKGFLIFLVSLYAVKFFIFDWSHIPSGSMEPTLKIDDRIIQSRSYYDLRIPFTNISIFKINDIEHGDVVLFDEPKTDSLFIKRVIGTEGDHIVIDGHNIKINGKLIAKSNPVIEDGYVSYIETHNNKSYKVKYNVKLDKIQQLLKMKENKEFQKSPRYPDFLNNYSNFLNTYSVFRKGEWTVPEGHIFLMGDNRDNSNDSRFDVSFLPTTKVVGKAYFVLANIKGIELKIGDSSYQTIPMGFTEPFRSIYSVPK